VARLGQNFLGDPNLLAAIVRESGVGSDDVVLEVGGGEGVLSTRVAPLVRKLYVVEIDRQLEPRLTKALRDHENAELIWADAMQFDLRALDPEPTAMVANLPYSVATPVLIRTITELPRITSWTVMVQREIGDRLRAKPGTKTYGSPSVITQLACDVRMIRPVGRKVFFPPPRVDSALIGMRRHGPGADPWTATVVRGGFKHRRKTMAGSLALAGVTSAEAARDAIAAAGFDPGTRAEALAPDAFPKIASHLDPNRRKDGAPDG